MVAVDGEKEFYEGLEKLADKNQELVEGEAGDARGERGREIDLQILREMVYSLESVSMGTHQLLYFSALRYTRDYTDCESEGMEEAIRKLADVFDSMNLGSLSRREGSEPEKLEVEGNAFTSGAPESGRRCVTSWQAILRDSSRAASERASL
ncbi:MAG: hypothetical protein SVS85_01740 [Candidatus Nanohaloarchaea archaeon]|nr:hypothetical protein [Candidatus Nanohaloarchaea archaeon]